MLIFAISIFAVGASALEPPEVDASTVGAVYLYNFENDTVLYEMNSQDVIYPASTVKIMSGIIAIEAVGDDLDREITVTSEMLSNVYGNNIGLVAGEVVSVRDMLYAMLVGGANDAAYVLAYDIAGSPEAFVARMNERAAALGATATHYTNPTGMHDNAMITTVEDTATIAKNAFLMPLYMTITSEAKYVMEATNKSEYRNIYSKNYLIAKNLYSYYYYEGAQGMNAGSTSQAGQALVSTCSKSGLTYLAIAMGGAEDRDTGALYNYVAVRTLFDWAFESYAYREVLSNSLIVCEIPVKLSSALDYVTLMPEEPISLFLPTDVDLDAELSYTYKTLSDELTAPIESGDEVGMITVSLGDEIVGTVPLVTTVAVARSEFLYVMDNIKKFAQGKFFIATAVCAVIFSVLYVLIQASRRHSANLKKQRRRR